MATWYSDHFGADGDNDTSREAPKNKVGAGIHHGRVYYKRARFKGMPLITEVVRMMTFKSSDRIRDLRISTDSGSAAGAVDVGLYLTGNANDGAVVDVDLFATAVDLGTAALDSTAIFSEAGGAAFGVNRGSPLWQVLGLSADPFVTYDLCMTVTTSFTTADSVICIEATYTALG